MKNDYIQNLLKRIAAQDDQIAFREIFQTYFTKLLNLARYFVTSEMVAEEMVSNVFVKIWNNRAQITEISSLEKYLYTAVKNQCYNYLRDNQRYLFQPLETYQHTAISDYQNPETQLLNSELRDELKKAVDNLPPKCKVIFKLVREDGLKYHEAAEILGISPKTVDVQIGRAVQKLRAALEQYAESKPTRHLGKALLITVFLSFLFA